MQKCVKGFYNQGVTQGVTPCYNAELVTAEHGILYHRLILQAKLSYNSGS